MAESQSAAKQALQKLEHQLQCAICLDPYKDPKLLHCFHFFCKECLERLVVQDQQGQLSTRCPTCRRSTLLPANSVSGLQSAFHIQHLFEIKEAFEKVDKEPQEAASIEPLENPAVSRKKVSYCRFHQERELELYCETCDELVCLKCALRLHNGHQYDLVSEVFEKHKSEIIASLKPVETQLGTVNKALQQLDTQREQITDQRAAIEAEIHQTIQHLHQALDARKTELIGQLDHMTQQKLKKLAAQRDEVEMIQTQLNSCLEFVRESLKTGSQGEVVNMKKPVVNQIKEMTANFNPDTLQAVEVANTSFVVSSEFIKDCLEFGTIYLQHYATGQGLERAVLGEVTTAVIHGEGECDNVNCELVSDVTGEKIKCRVKQLKKNQYEISFQPTTRGRHQLHIKVEDEHIKGSPFTVMVKLPVQKLGTPIKTIGGLNYPWGVAVNKRGELMVAEHYGHCVSIFSLSGEKLRSLSGERQFSAPCGVAVDDDDSILVVESGYRSVTKHTPDGQFIRADSFIDNNKLVFDRPYGITIHPLNKKVYVADRYGHCIQVLNPDLTFFNPLYDHDKRHLQFPWDVAVDNTGNVYVVDTWDRCVKVFTVDGQFLRNIGRHQLYFPSSIAIDSDNVMYVTDRDNNCVSVFTCEGQLLTSFGTRGNGPGQFNNPCGIAVDNCGVVYVSDTDNGRVQIF